MGDAKKEGSGAMANPSKCMHWKEMLKQAKSFKEEGNALFKGKMYKKAAGKYHRGLLYLKGIESKQNQLPFPFQNTEPVHLSSDDLAAVSALRVDIYNNLAGE